MRLRTLGAALLAVTGFVASCGGVGRPASREVVAVPLTRPSPPADAPAARLLAAGSVVVAMPRAGSLDVHARPGTERPYMSVEAENPWGQRLRLLVLRDRLDTGGDIWLRVQVPIWPNGQEGWVPAEAVRLKRSHERIVVDLSRRRLVRYRGEDVVTRLRVAVGSPSTPTPPGRYFVWAKVPTGRPAGPYGSYVVGLSGFSEAIQPWEWPGEPRLAIHGTADPADAGQAVSHGCVRVPNVLLHHLRDVPMGTPVTIRP
jgi:lipoprotein-anchoring transpeptidase ErfK/SrfK